MKEQISTFWKNELEALRVQIATEKATIVRDFRYEGFLLKNEISGLANQYINELADHVRFQLSIRVKEKFSQNLESDSELSRYNTNLESTHRISIGSILKQELNIEMISELERRLNQP